MTRFLFVSLLCFNLVQAQKLSKSDNQLITYLKSHVEYLSSEGLEGRRAGTQGEKLASEYITSKFKEVGLVPKGINNSFLQPFTINDGKKILPNTVFKINQALLDPTKDFFPLPFSANTNLQKALTSPSLMEKDQPWMVDLAQDLTDGASSPHFDINNLIAEKIKKAIEHKSSALILFNSSQTVDNIYFEKKDKTETSPIPVIYITKDAYLKYFKDSEASYDIEYAVEIGDAFRSSNNVVGYIDNNAPLTIVLGAHFDHLGYGEDGNSMLRGTQHMIHNGADDNASGTSALLELAFLLKKIKSKQYNFLFIAFSAEELGLNGSKYFVEHPTVDLSKVNYMINMDMVGRLNDSSRVITLGGVGTSPQWGERIAAVKNSYLKFRYDSSGTGPSDHTSFYRKDIPVLFFFTGLHTDYHKPSDDADKLNYKGELMIIKFIQDLIINDKTSQKLAFAKTREQQTSTSARFSVSMGIMPDYTFSGAGVRVDGVSDNRPAKKAGVLAGDIVKQLGDYKTTSVEGYMQALSKFKKGDQTKVIISRENKELIFEIVF
jgi:aminopeptidase YwaD